MEDFAKELNNRNSTGAVRHDRKMYKTKGSDHPAPSASSTDELSNKMERMLYEEALKKHLAASIPSSDVKQSQIPPEAIFGTQISSPDNMEGQVLMGFCYKLYRFSFIFYVFRQRLIKTTFPEKEAILVASGHIRTIKKMRLIIYPIMAMKNITNPNQSEAAKNLSTILMASFIRRMTLKITTIIMMRTPGGLSF